MLAAGLDSQVVRVALEWVRVALEWGRVVLAWHPVDQEWCRVVLEQCRVVPDWHLSHLEWCRAVRLEWCPVVRLGLVDQVLLVDRRLNPLALVDRVSLLPRGAVRPHQLQVAIPCPQPRLAIPCLQPRLAIPQSDRTHKQTKEPRPGVIRGGVL